MKKITRLLVLVFALLMVISMVACGNTTDNKTSDTDNTANTNDGKTYIIYSDNGFAPFEYLDENSGTYVGVDMDLLAAIAEDQGFKYEMHNEGFDASMGAVQAGQADAMIAGMTINDTRKETFDFSEGYFEDGSILVVAKDSEIKAEADLAGKIVAAKTGTVSTDYAESLKETLGFEIMYFESSAEMYQAVIGKNADACFEDRSVIGWAIENEGVELQTVGEVVNPNYYGFATKKGSNAELIEMFNNGLQNIKASGKYQEILANYGY